MHQRRHSWPPSDDRDRQTCPRCGLVAETIGTYRGQRGHLYEIIRWSRQGEIIRQRPIRVTVAIRPIVGGQADLDALVAEAPIGGVPECGSGDNGS